MALLPALGNFLLGVDDAIRARRTAKSPFGGQDRLTRVAHGSGHVAGVEDGDGRVVLTSFADAVRQHPVVWAVRSKLVRELSTLGLGVFRRIRDETGVDTGEVEPAPGTSLERLLREPAPGLGLIDLLQWIYGPQLDEGNSLLGLWRPEGADGPVRGLIPLDWRYLSAFARPGGPIEYWVSMQAGTAEGRILRPRDVLHTAWHGPGAWQLGVAPLEPLSDTVAVEAAARRFQRAALRNGARPLGALVLPPRFDKTGAPVNPTPAELDQLEDRANHHRGVDNAFRTAVLYGGVEWRPMAFSAQQMELDPTRARSREEVCVAYDVRWSQLADPPSGATVDPDALARDLHRTLRPHAALAANAINRQLVDPSPEWGPDGEDLLVAPTFGELLAGSPEQQMNRAVNAFRNGIWSRNRARAEVSEPPTGDEADDRPLTPHSQLAPAGGRDGRDLPASQDPQSEGNRVERGELTQPQSP